MTKTLNPMIGQDLYICEGQSGLRFLLGESSSPWVSHASFITFIQEDHIPRIFIKLNHFNLIITTMKSEDSTHLGLQTASSKGVDPEVKKWPPRADDSCVCLRSHNLSAELQACLPPPCSPQLSKPLPQSLRENPPTPDDWGAHPPPLLSPSSPPLTLHSSGMGTPPSWGSKPGSWGAESLPSP